MVSILAVTLLLAEAGGTTLTLEEALRRAAENDPVVRAFDSRIEAEEALSRAVGRRFLLDPELELSGERALETGRYADRAVGAVLSDDLVLSSSPARLKAAASARAEAGRLERTARTSERSLDLLESVLSSRRLDRVQALQDELAATLEVLSKTAQKRVADGVVGPTEATLAAAEAARWRSSAQATSSAALEARARIAALLGERAAPAITGEPERGALPPEPSRLTRRAIETNPALLALGRRVAAGQALVEAARAGRVPRLRLGVGATQEVAAIPAGTGGVREEEILVGAQVGIRLPVGRIVRAEVLAASADLRALEADRTWLERRIALEVESGWNARRLAEERVRGLEAVQEELPRAMDRLIVAYREGRVALDSYLTQRERLYEAGAALVEALRERDEADIRLARALGGPWGTSLLPPEENR